MTPEEKARKAQLLKDDPFFAEVLEAVRQQYLSNFETSQPADTVKREGAYAGLRALEDIRARINTFINDPKVRAHNSRVKP